MENWSSVGSGSAANPSTVKKEEHTNDLFNP